jgi:hypothetical protein
MSIYPREILMEVPMTNFRLDVSRETGTATLWMATNDTACGYKPVLAWPSMDGVKEFAQMLLEIERYRKGESGNGISYRQTS